jgi:nucleoside-diphosphate-sugar epimerase
VSFLRKIVVTGATGFVGANLVHALIEQKDVELYVITRSSSHSSRLDSIKHKFKEILYVSLDNRNELFKLIERIKPDIVYHLATYGGFPNQADQTQMIQSNLQATMNLLDASIAYGVKTFINTGSSSEYGLKDAPMTETDVCEPVNFYGITKLAATNYCTMLGKNSQTKVCTLRLFSPYGPLEDRSRLYASIIDALSRDESSKLSRPQSVRDFIEIEKVVQVYLEIVQADFQSGDIVNVASGKQQTIEQFYQTIARKLDKEHIKPTWGEAPPRANEPLMWQADISKLKALLPQIL